MRDSPKIFFFMGIITALLKSLKILVDFLVVTTVSLNRWQYHM